MAVAMKSNGTQVEVVHARMLFGGQTLPVLPGTDASNAPTSRLYMTPDGKRIVIPVPINVSSETPLDLLTNWTSALGFKK